MNQPPRPPVAAFGWAVLAVFAFFLSLMTLFNTALLDAPRWWYADRYVPAELEVTRFDDDPRPPKRGGRTIDGVVHPGGKRGLTSTRDLSVREFVAPADRAVPTRGEIVGRRIAVWHWPNHMDEYRWWYPPTLIMPGDTPTVGRVARSG